MTHEIVKFNSKFSIEEFDYININLIAGKLFTNDYMSIDFKKLLINKEIKKESFFGFSLSHIGIGLICHIKKEDIERILGIELSFFEKEYQHFLINKNLKIYGLSLLDKNREKNHIGNIFASEIKFSNLEVNALIEINSINVDNYNLENKKISFDDNIKFYSSSSLFKTTVSSKELASLEKGDFLFVYKK